MLTAQQKVLLVLGLAVVFAAAGAAIAIALDEPETSSDPLPSHEMPTDDRCAHMPEHCGGYDHG